MNNPFGALASLLFLAFGLVSANALSQQPARFNFVFEGTSSDARAAGYVVFDLELLPNPGRETYSLPNPAVLDFRVTVTGATSGNGTFLLDEFASLNWYTTGQALDLAPGRQVVGQFNWGPPCNVITPIDAPCGAFNFYGIAEVGDSGGPDSAGNRGASGAAPDGLGAFHLRADGGNADEMRLTSFIRGVPEPVSVPVLSPASWLLMATLLLGIAWVTQRTRS